MGTPWLCRCRSSRSAPARARGHVRRTSVHACQTPACALLSEQEGIAESAKRPGGLRTSGDTVDESHHQLLRRTECPANWNGGRCKRRFASQCCTRCAAGVRKP